MNYALYLNGAPEEALREIVRVQHEEPSRVCYIQPHGERDIKRFVEAKPSPASPVPIYISTTTKLEAVSYVGLVVDWRRKSSLEKSTKAELDKHIKQFQPSEGSIYLEMDGKAPANLITVSDFHKVRKPFSVSRLRKISDGTPHGVRTQAGSYSYVQPLDIQAEVESDLEELEEVDLRQLIAKLEGEVEESLEESARVRASRLAKADPLPEKVVTRSVGFKRNPDVIVAVLERAAGTCEECYRPAPFRRRRDGSPYLEVHHREMLSMGGEDTVENAMAVCPNCHRKLHFG